VAGATREAGISGMWSRRDAAGAAGRSAAQIAYRRSARHDPSAVAAGLPVGYDRPVI